MESKGSKEPKELKESNRAVNPRGEIARKRYFGRYLRVLRETYSERLELPDADTPVLRARPTVSAVTECMRAGGFDIGATAYSEIENGINVPRDAEAFLSVVSQCLRLNRDQYRELAERLAHDILSVRLGDTAEAIYPAKPHWNEEHS